MSRITRSSRIARREIHLFVPISMGNPLWRLFYAFLSVPLNAKAPFSRIFNPVCRVDPIRRLCSHVYSISFNPLQYDDHETTLSN